MQEHNKNLSNKHYCLKEELKPGQQLIKNKRPVSGSFICAPCIPLSGVRVDLCLYKQLPGYSLMLFLIRHF